MVHAQIIRLRRKPDLKQTNQCDLTPVLSSAGSSQSNKRAGPGSGQRCQGGSGGGGAAAPGGGAAGGGAGGTVSPHSEGPLEPGHGDAVANALTPGPHANAHARRSAGGKRASVSS